MRTTFFKMARVVVATSSSVLGIACADGGSPTRTVTEASPPRNLTASTVSPAELHARNPFDWAGRVHNLFVRAALVEFRKPGTRIIDLCSRMQSWVEESSELHALLPTAATGSQRDHLRAALRQSALCVRRPRIGNASLPAGDLPPAVAALDELSSAAEALIADVETALAGATSPSNLASSLSPILSAASSLGTEASAVELAAAVAQSSYEEWYGGTALHAIADPMEADMEQCTAGQWEEQTYVLGDITYICRNSEWLQAKWHPGSTGPFRMWKASYSSAALSCSMNWSGVAFDDYWSGLVALYAAVQSGAFFANPPLAAEGIALISASTSALSAMNATVNYLKCVFNIF